MLAEELRFVNYEKSYLEVCLKLFDENCPAFFAKNERKDYLDFLSREPQTYQIGFLNGKIVSAFGFDIDKQPNRGRISWIMVSPTAKGKGIGSKIMLRVKETAQAKGVRKIDIAASHLSAPFFTQFGAIKIDTIPNGWGPNMDRIDMELAL